MVLLLGDNQLIIIHSSHMPIHLSSETMPMRMKQGVTFPGTVSKKTAKNKQTASKQPVSPSEIVSSSIEGLAEPSGFASILELTLSLGLKLSPVVRPEGQSENGKQQPVQCNAPCGNSAALLFNSNLKHWSNFQNVSTGYSKLLLLAVIFPTETRHKSITKTFYYFLIFYLLMIYNMGKKDVISKHINI